MKMPETLSTDRLLLRMPRTEDARTIFEGWAQDPEVVRYLIWRPHKSIDETEGFVHGCILAWENQMRFPYMITLKDGGEAIGMIDAHIHPPEMEIGYGLGRAYWGKGYMPEATRAVIDWAFQQPSIYRVCATTDIENVASQRVLEKVGMKYEGTLHKYIIHPNISDIPRDSYIFAITK